MHAETVGYISIDKDDMQKVNDAIDKFQTSDLDCYPSEIMTEADANLIAFLVSEKVISHEDAETLAIKCDIIKFYT